MTTDTLECLDTDTDAAHIEVDADSAADAADAAMALTLIAGGGAAPVALIGAAVIWFLSRYFKRRRAKPTPKV